MLDDFHEAHFERERREEEPEPTAKAYYDMLTAAQEPLSWAYQGFTTGCHCRV